MFSLRRALDSSSFWSGKVQVINLDKCCPSTRDFQASFDKVQELCTFGITPSAHPLAFRPYNQFSRLRRSQRLANRIEMASQSRQHAVDGRRQVKNRLRCVAYHNFISRACLDAASTAVSLLHERKDSVLIEGQSRETLLRGMA